MTQSSKICYMGAYDPDYARNHILRKGLAENGVEVVECRVSPRVPLWRRYFSLLKEYMKISSDFEVILVAEMNQFIVPLAKCLALLQRKKLVFDMFFSVHDSHVEDRKFLEAGSLKARFWYMVDKLGLVLPDVILTDTREHAKFFIKRFGALEEKMSTLYVGCNSSLFFPREKPQTGTNRFTVTFMGTFIPLHGIEYILKAAKLLEAQTDIHFEIIGKGQTSKDMRTLAATLQLHNCSFLGAAPLQEIPHLLARADICLGIFGHTKKATRVIPNKVYQAMAMKKAVISGDSPAIRELFQDSEHVLLCRMADEHALADAILTLHQQPSLRNHLAENGYRLITERFTPSTLGKQLKELLESQL